MFSLTEVNSKRWQLTKMSILWDDEWSWSIRIDKSIIERLIVFKRYMKQFKKFETRCMNQLKEFETTINDKIGQTQWNREGRKQPSIDVVVIKMMKKMTVVVNDF